MKLTAEDEAALLEMGHLEEDIPQLRIAARKAKIEYQDGYISHERAVELLGRHTYLTGISRCAFHASALRETPTGETVYFTYRWW